MAKITKLLNIRRCSFMSGMRNNEPIKVVFLADPLLTTSIEFFLLEHVAWVIIIPSIERYNFMAIWKGGPTWLIYKLFDLSFLWRYNSLQKLSLWLFPFKSYYKCRSCIPLLTRSHILHTSFQDSRHYYFEKFHRDYKKYSMDNFPATNSK